MTILYIRIQSLCKSRKLSINALEKNVGLARNSIQKWKTALPLCSSVLAVSNYLNVSVDYLLGNTDNPQSHKSPDTLRATLTSVAETLKREAETIEEVLNAPAASNNSDE